MVKRFYILTIIIFNIIGIGFAHAQYPMISQITQSIETDFGTYQPYPAEFAPQAPPFTVDDDFSNVTNYPLYSINFTKTDETLLKQNHFTVRHSQHKQLYDIYNDCTWSGTPLFVTTDAVLHIYHVLFDQMLANIEEQIFYKKLDVLLTTLITDTEIQYTQCTKTVSQEASLRNLAFLVVARRLLKGESVPIPDYVSDWVNDELDLIESGDGFHISPIFGSFSALDYSQFKPRGHYTKSPELEAYFQTMMWLSWTIFTIEPDKFGILSNQHTLQALLLTQQVHSLESCLSTWNEIYQPTVFFSGKTDDPSILDYSTIAQTVYGPDFLEWTPDSLADSTLMDTFITEAQKLPEPLIPNWIYGVIMTYKGFRFMGQRFIPDSYLFAHLVLPDIPGRYFPKGLDIAAIMGSQRAFTLLDSIYQQTAHDGYETKIQQFNLEFSTKPESQWAQNLYWNWLYTLMPLLYEKGEGYPTFMQCKAWQDKELMTMLASWAELRHDTILYSKQSATPCCITPGPPRSVVEPNPHLFARLASLVQFTREGLAKFDLLMEDYIPKLDRFEELLLFLRDVSIKELENVPLSEKEYDNLYCFGKVMKNLVSVADDPHLPFESQVDDMAVIADVHTDHNSSHCMEVGVGYPLEIYVIVNEGGFSRITRGAIFSYYEFHRHLSLGRLTDEEWRLMLASETPPSLPQWAASFMDAEVEPLVRLDYSPENLFHKEFTSVQDPREHKTIQGCHLYQNYPNPSNPETTIRFDLSKSSHVILSVYNLMGQRMTTIKEGDMSVGYHEVIWNGKNKEGFYLPSGLYFIQLKTNLGMQARKICLVR